MEDYYCLSALRLEVEEVVVVPRTLEVVVEVAGAVVLA